MHTVPQSTERAAHMGAAPHRAARTDWHISDSSPCCVPQQRSESPPPRPKDTQQHDPAYSTHNLELFFCCPFSTVSVFHDFLLYQNFSSDFPHLTKQIRLGWLAADIYGCQTCKVILQWVSSVTKQSIYSKLNKHASRMSLKQLVYWKHSAPSDRTPSVQAARADDRLREHTSDPAAQHDPPTPPCAHRHPRRMCAFHVAHLKPARGNCTPSMQHCLTLCRRGSLLFKRKGLLRVTVTGRREVEKASPSFSL